MAPSEPPYLLPPTLYLHVKLPVTELPLPKRGFGHNALKVTAPSGAQDEKALCQTRPLGPGGLLTGPIFGT